VVVDWQLLHVYGVECGSKIGNCYMYIELNVVVRSAIVTCI